MSMDRGYHDGTELAVRRPAQRDRNLRHRRAGGWRVINAVTSLLVFCALTGSAFGGAALHRSAPHMLASTEARDVVRRVVSLIAVLAALMLGMGIASLKSSFDGANRDLRRLGSQIEELDRTLRRIGPVTTEARHLLFRYTAGLVGDIFPDMDAPLRGEPRDADELQDELEASLERLGDGPTVSRVAIQAQAVLHAIVQTRWTIDDRTGRSVSNWQLGVLVFWLMLVFAGFGLFAPRNALVVSVLVLCALALAFAIFLLTEFDAPFRGIIAVSAEPLQNALRALADD